MPNLDFESATDVLLLAFKEHWYVEAQDVLGYVPDIEWPGVKVDKPKSRDKDEPWARITLRHTGGRQRTFGEEGCRRFQRVGIVSVQVFTPKGERGLTLGQRLGKVAVDAFEGRDLSGVQTRRTTLREGGNSDAHWQQTNVTTEFEYDVVK